MRFSLCKGFFTGFVFLLLSSVAGAQVSEPDADSLNKLSESVRYSSPRSSAFYAQEALRHCGSGVSGKKQKVDALVNWSYALVESGALDSAAIVADSVKQNAAGIRDSSILSAVLVLQGYLCDYEEKNDEALRFYFEGLELCPDLKHRAAICNNIGSVYKVMQDLGNAEKYYAKSYSIGVQLGDSVRQGKCLNNLGSIFYSRREFPEALKHYKQSLQIREAIGDSVGMTSCFSNIAMVYEEMNKPDSALILYRRAMDFGIINQRPLDVVIARINIGNLFFKQQKKTDAFRELQMAASLSDSIGLHYYSRLAHRSLANYYAQTGDYRNAYLNYVKFAAYNDSVLTESSQKTTQELELRYRTREHVQQIQLLQQEQKAARLENENQESELGQQRKLLLIVVLVSLVIFLLAFLIFQRYRAERKHAVELERIVSEKDMLLREIHHRVKNNLQLVSSLLSLQDAHSAGDGKNALRQNQERIHTLSLLHEQLYRSADLKAISFREYVQTLLEHIAASFSGNSSSVRLVSEADDCSFDIDQLVPCGLIINELVTNSFKYAFPSGKGTVHVEMRQQGEECILLVADDGIGLPQKENASPSTLGLRLVNGLCRQLRGTISVETAPGKGAQFRIIFPFKNKSND